MAQKGFSARGIIVDFEMLKIKAQLAAIPAATTVSARRTFIEEKAGLTKRETIKPADALMAGAIGLEEQVADDADVELVQIDAASIVEDSLEAPDDLKVEVEVEASPKKSSKGK